MPPCFTGRPLANALCGIAITALGAAIFAKCWFTLIFVTLLFTYTVLYTLVMFTVFTTVVFDTFTVRK